MRTWTEGIWLFLPHPDQTGPLSGPAAPPGLRVAPSQAKRSPCTPTFRPSAGIDEIIACAESRPRLANSTQTGHYRRRASHAPTAHQGSSRVFASFLEFPAIDPAAAGEGRSALAE